MCFKYFKILINIKCNRNNHLLEIKFKNNHCSYIFCIRLVKFNIAINIYIWCRYNYNILIIWIGTFRL